MSRSPQSIGLMTDGTIGEEDFFAALGRGHDTRTFILVLIAFLVRTRCPTERVKTIAAETSGITAKISTAKKDGKPIDRDQPERERLEAGERFSLFALDGSVNLLDILGFTIVHPLPDPAFWRRRVLVHFASFVGAGGGEAEVEAGAGTVAVPFTSGRACDWSSDIR